MRRKTRTIGMLTLLTCFANLGWSAEQLRGHGGVMQARALAVAVVQKTQAMSARVLNGGNHLPPQGHQLPEFDPWNQGGVDEGQMQGEFEGDIRPQGGHFRPAIESYENDVLAANALVTLGRDYRNVVGLIDNFSATGNCAVQAQACGRIRQNAFKTEQAKQLLYVPGPSGILSAFEFDDLLRDQRNMFYALGCR